MAAFLSLTVGLVACQLGSCVQSSKDKRFNCVVGDEMDDNGDAGVLRGWLIIPSLCKTIDGDIGLVDSGDDPDIVLGDSAG